MAGYVKPTATLSLTATAALSGCYIAGQMEFTAVAMEPAAVHMLILAKDVEAEICPAGGAYPPFDKAAQEAIASVPGANTLVNVSFTRYERFPFKSCIKVKGDAAAIQ